MTLTVGGTPLRRRLVPTSQLLEAALTTPSTFLPPSSLTSAIEVRQQLPELVLTACP